MQELNEKYLINFKGKSSKGNQLKWNKDDVWYKADLNGYEGLSEYVVSHLLKYSNLNKDDIVLYQTEKIKYKFAEYNGCSSKNFLLPKQSLITLNRMMTNIKGVTLTSYIENFSSAKERMKRIVGMVEDSTGIQRFGQYLANMMLIDAFFLNEDRHLHNIALISKENGEYTTSPIFDNGAALLSDTQMDYPMHGPLQEMISSVKSRTFDSDFEVQLDAAESLYGIDLTFDFDDETIIKTVNEESNYTDMFKERIIKILIGQREKYQYFFK